MGIANVRDRVVQQSMLKELSPFFEPGFSESSHGFREGHSQKGAIEAASKHVGEGKQWVVDIDLGKYLEWLLRHD